MVRIVTVKTVQGWATVRLAIDTLIANVLVVYRLYTCTCKYHDSSIDTM